LGHTAVVGMIKLAIDAGKANPAPPIGPALGAKVCFAHPAVRPLQMRNTALALALACRLLHVRV